MGESALGTRPPSSWKKLSKSAKHRRSLASRVRTGLQYLSFHSLLAADKRVRKTKMFLKYFLAFGYKNTLTELIKMPYCPLIALRRWCWTAHAHTCGLPATSRSLGRGPEVPTCICLWGRKSFPNFVFAIWVLTIKHCAETKALFLEVGI